MALPIAAASALALVGCSSRDTSEASPGAAAAESAAASIDDSALEGDRSAASEGPGETGASPTSRSVLSLEGLGDLVIGKPIPASSSFAERGAQISDSCHTVTSPDYPGVYALTENGQVRRITVGERSDVKLAEGIGVGSAEAEVLKAFPGFRSTPHKYVEAPGKYLTQPGDDPRLRFEIGADRRVSLIHVGLTPQLGYVEGCA